MKSIGAMIKQVSGLVGTGDLTDWESSFIQSVERASGGGADTGKLSDRQVEIVEQIYGKHFA